MTPSHVAAAHGEVGVLAFLLEHHANANKKNEGNWTPLAPRSWSSVQADSVYSDGMEQRLPFQGVQLASCSPS